jgi:hypothetical protein
MKGTRTNTVADGGGKDIVAHSINGLPRCWLKWTARVNRMSPFRSKIGSWLALTALAARHRLWDGDQWRDCQNIQTPNTGTS